MARNYVTIESIHDLAFATFAKSHLESHGIAARLSNEGSVGWTGRYAMIARGVRLMVPAPDERKARKVFEELQSSESQLDEDTLKEYTECEIVDYVPRKTVTATRCPNCRSSQIREIKHEGVVWMALNIVFLFLPSFLTKPRWVCLKCDWEWTPGEDSD
jgi:predicted Zn-ribbon and HTH transcriptional regulator